MANLIIKPTSGGSLILQDEGGDAAVTVGTTGSTTLAGTANALGTVATANLSNNNIVMPRFKEFDSFFYTTSTATTTDNLTALNISGSSYVTMTPEATGDILEFGWFFNLYCPLGYGGIGVQRATDTGFSAGVTTVFATGTHGIGVSEDTNDSSHYKPMGASVFITCAGLTVDTPYYFRMIGQTHGSTTITFGNTVGSHTNMQGIRLHCKRWSIV